MKYILAAIIITSLYISNPSIEDFSFFLREQTYKKMKVEDPNVNAFASEFLSSAALEATYRKNFYLFSKYTVNTSSLRLFAPSLPIRIDIWGIGGQFILATKL